MQLPFINFKGTKRLTPTMHIHEHTAYIVGSVQLISPLVGSTISSIYLSSIALISTRDWNVDTEIVLTTRNASLSTLQCVCYSRNMYVYNVNAWGFTRIALIVFG